MVITILTASVDPGKSYLLEKAFNEGINKLDPGIVETYLMNEAKESSHWKIFTVWESREALEAMRNSGEVPKGVMMFKLAGADPALSIYRVVSHGEKSA